MSEKAIPDLLPCPFCGWPPSIEMTRGNGRLVYCASDDCMGPRTTAANIEDAAQQWNKRSAVQERRVPDRVWLMRAMCHVEQCNCAGRGGIVDDYDACRIVSRHANAIVKALSSPPAPASEGWREIGTVPKNATEVELRIPKKGWPGFYRVIAHWADGGGDEQPRFRGWFRDTGYGFAEIGDEPDAWRPAQPLPAPPVAEPKAALLADIRATRPNECP